MHITLVHQPDAGDATQPAGSELQQLIRAAGHDVRYVSARADWQSGLGTATDLVVVAGGDGTVGRVAQALVGRPVPFTALPLGTANNISRTLGLADRPIPELIAGWAHAKIDRFDVGVALGPWGERYFIEGCGAGLFACTLPEADANATLTELAFAEARLAYALQMLRDRLTACPTQRLELRLDGRDVSGDYLLVEAMNMQYVGPNLYLAPACDLADGLLDVVFVPADARAELQRYLADWQNGREWPATLRMHRCARLEMRWTGYPLHIDDAVWPESGTSAVPAGAWITLEVRREALQFLNSA